MKRTKEIKPTNNNSYFDIVKKYIDKWDPYGFFPEAPKDEYDYESRTIANNINLDSDVNEIAGLIAEVFNKSFDERFTIASCKEPAESIYKNLK